MVSRIESHQLDTIVGTLGYIRLVVCLFDSGCGRSYRLVFNQWVHKVRITV